METAKFKANIMCSGCVAKVTHFLNESFGEDNWKVDTSDPSKILTVVNEQDRAKIIRAVERAGYKAEEI